MATIAILTDTHYGARKGSKLFHDYFELFYKNIFFPKLEEYNVDAVIHMGDVFDSRKSIDYQSLQWAKKVVFEPLSKYETHMIIGNHDCYYKNTNGVNSPELLLEDYANIRKYSIPENVNIKGFDFTLIPWICSENYDQTLRVIKKSKAKVALGHLELNGFLANKDHVIEHGMDRSLFSKFEKVFSGHFHTRSSDGQIFYLGNPYEIYWNDVNDVRGFTIFDTDTLQHSHIDNPYKMFYNVYYEDTPFQLINFTEYKNKIVKVIVRKKSSAKNFEKFMHEMYNSGAFDIKIVENFQINDSEEIDDLEDEDTMAVLNSYVKESEIPFNKNTIIAMIKDIYDEARGF